MQFRTLASFAAAASVMVLAPALAHAAPQDFSLDNETGYTIKSLYIAPTSTSDWGPGDPDILGEAVLPSGIAAPIHFPGGRGETCFWDLKVAYEDDSSHEWSNVNLCAITTVTIHYDEGTHSTSAESQ
jgi:hypothetical protein